MKRWADNRFGCAIAGWTIGLVLLALIVAAEAIYSLYRADQACFFEYPNVPCPTIGDPAFIRLEFVFFGIPLIWFVGIAAAFVARALRHRKDGDS